MHGKALGLFRGREGDPASRTDIELVASMFGLYDQTDARLIRENLAAQGYEGDALEAQVDKEVKSLIAIRRNTPQKRPVKVLLHEVAHLARRRDPAGFRTRPPRPRAPRWRR